MSVALLSFCSFLSGVGSCSAFQAALKVATLNWPTHRGTATAFPLAAFGLSAFFYTFIAGVAFPGNTSSLLVLLSFGTSMVVLAALPFLHVVDHQTGTGYAVLTRSNGSKDSSRYSSSSIPPPEPSKHSVSFHLHAPLVFANRFHQTMTNGMTIQMKHAPFCLDLVICSQRTTQLVKPVGNRITHIV
jgi:hypothetical protein